VPSLKKSKSLFSFCLFFLFLFVFGYLWFLWGIAPKVKSNRNDSRSEIFVIRKGEKTENIVNRLYQAGLIKSRIAFKLLLYKEGLIGKIQAGGFRLSPTMSASEIAQKLTHGTFDQWLTIIEGWRREEIARKINSQFSIPLAEFMSKTENDEGFLFPDTYLIPQNIQTETLVKILKENFDKKIKNLEPEIKKSDLSLKEIIILASIVEREAKEDSDRPLVAGILIKRWQNNWPLQADATIQYALANIQCRQTDTQCDWWPKIKRENLGINSPYNTYRYLGLPPTPICNPGLSAIKAVINYQKSDYWYYLSDQKGRIHFARTLEEHKQNIKNYL